VICVDAAARHEPPSERDAPLQRCVYAGLVGICRGRDDRGHHHRCVCRDGRPQGEGAAGNLRGMAWISEGRGLGGEKKHQDWGICDASTSTKHKARCPMINRVTLKGSHTAAAARAHLLPTPAPSRPCPAGGNAASAAAMRARSASFLVRRGLLIGDSQTGDMLTSAAVAGPALSTPFIAADPHMHGHPHGRAQSAGGAVASVRYRGTSGGSRSPPNSTPTPPPPPPPSPPPRPPPPLTSGCVVPPPLPPLGIRLSVVTIAAEGEHGGQVSPKRMVGGEGGGPRGPLKVRAGRALAPAGTTADTPRADGRGVSSSRDGHNGGAGGALRSKPKAMVGSCWQPRATVGKNDGGCRRGWQRREGLDAQERGGG